MSVRRLTPLPAVLIGCVVTAAASLWFKQALNVSPGLAFIVMLLLGSGDVLERFGKWIDLRPIRVAAVPVGLWLLYAVYAAGMGVATARRLSVMAVYLVVPFLTFAPFRRRAAANRVEPFVILWLWLPLELGLIRGLLITTRGPDLHYAFAQLLAIDAGLVAFAVWNHTPQIGYRFEFDRNILVTGTVHFLIFAIIAIPLGLAIRFIKYSFGMSKLFLAPVAFSGIFLFTALPEEFLFRGLIQNWLERTMRKPVLSLAVAALIFGASHLNNGPPIPNYRYFLMATIAGIFYGVAWRRTGSLMASSLTHALVDTFWTVLFR